MKSLALLVALLSATPMPAKPLKVFVLAGQSNMEGKVKRGLLDHQATAPETRELFAHLRDQDEWLERDDVFVKFLGKKGPLTVGFGSGECSGVELEFGQVLGDHFEAPVLLIKTAWGGHSLYKDFRPPSAGIPEQRIRAELEQATRRVEESNRKNGKSDPMPREEDIRAAYGRSYLKLVSEVATTLSELDTLFPELAGAEPELAGLVWFQGWNDQYQGAEAEYASNLGHLIRDLRRDLAAPDLPVVIGVMGQNMSQEAKGPMLTIQEAQLSMEQVPEFAGTVKAVRTDLLVDQAAEALYPEWRERFDEWEKVGSDRPYHYLGSAIWHLRMGRAFGEAMIGMLGTPAE